MSLLRVAAAALAALATGATGTAGAAPVVGDPEARELTALRGTLVWATAAPGGRQVLMQRRGGEVTRVAGAPPARLYRSVDLGLDRRGRLVLTYLRCAPAPRCVARRDDLRGHRASFRRLAPRGCTLSTAPALWRSRAAYGVFCLRGDEFDRRRSGVYVKRGGGAPRLLPRPRDAVRFGSLDATSVDLRGRRVGSILSDILAYAVSQDADGGRLRAVLIAASEGESDQRAVGLAAGRGGAVWTLTQAEHVGDPLRTVIRRLVGRCDDSEVLVSPPDDLAFRGSDLAVDGRRLYVAVPGEGIVRHHYEPARPC